MLTILCFITYQVCCITSLVTFKVHWFCFVFFVFILTSPKLGWLLKEIGKRKKKKKKEEEERKKALWINPHGCLPFFFFFWFLGPHP